MLSTAKIYLSALLTLVVLSGNAQLNSYGEVTSISGTVINLGSVLENTAAFEDGGYIIIMQMQDDVIGNTTNTSAFGTLGSIQSAGLYEIRQIVSHTEIAGIPTSVTLDAGLFNTYNIGPNSSVQIISFPQLGSPDYTTTGALNATPWNGTIGGVLALQVPGTLTLAHSLSASGAGFRGGLRSINYYSGGTGCSTTEYIRFSNHTRAGQKGEGIYKTTNNDFLYARGHLLNGGGGGSERINCGGGGGGNFTQGGEGGYGWSCAGPGGGGLGGIDLSAHISATRVFMGGGGGGGQQNNNQSRDGGNGGGIILLKADEIRTSGTCGGINITANGITPVSAGNDGQAGGGAGGSIVIEVNTWNIDPSCPITVSSSGGNGASVNSSTHAGGGGGAQGVVIYSIAQPTVNTTTITNNGSAGCNNNSNPCNNAAGSPSGSSNTGIIDASAGPLPIELLYFETELLSSGVVSNSWLTASEINNRHFIIQRSFNGWQWINIDTVAGSGTTSTTMRYTSFDSQPISGINYYRLLQEDFDGSQSISAVNTILVESSEFSVFPNPGTGKFVWQGLKSGTLRVFNASGALIKETEILGGKTEVDLSAYPSGSYQFLFITHDGIRASHRIIKH